MLSRCFSGFVLTENLRKYLLYCVVRCYTATAVIIQTTSTALVSKLNALDAQKQELVRQLQKAQEDSGERGLSEEALALSFKQAREMLKAGQLPCDFAGLNVINGVIF